MTCQYVMIINTPRLCADPLFYDTLASTAYSIKCRLVVADDRIKPEVGEEQGRQKNNHIQSNAAIGDADDTQETGGSESGYYEMVAEAEADAGDENPRKHTGIRSPEKATSSDERKRPQVVLSINDPNLATGHESEEQREVIRRALAIMYGDENLNVGFANASDNSDEEQEDTKAAEKSHLHDEL
ncbi:hypothetical protein LPJ57_001407 [Coemansia sp. RSA 486]|nr:hypothetical protein LPJ57_001407 [Coemansia sp. RSA 486]